MILPEDLEKSGSSSLYTSRPSSTIYFLLPYIWWQLDDFFIGQARTAGLSTHFKLAQIDSEELYTDTKFSSNSASVSTDRGFLYGNLTHYTLNARDRWSDLSWIIVAVNFTISQKQIGYYCCNFCCRIPC
ncbi:predicted protein [Botrytis cinerea T4]|uniref:Uncharacterized protein n=1 Tax=Botryotinia fuckeliana (strain T4) TaxID=999810 RepID=G2YSZ8_BOTF4|nr:predicted protein [Botrytis cinerea T4]